MISSAVCVPIGMPAVRAVRLAEPGVEDAQVVVDLGDGADGRARALARRLLLDADGRRQAGDVLDLRLLHLAEELAGVAGQRLDVAPLALGVDRVERQRRSCPTRSARRRRSSARAGCRRSMFLRLCWLRPLDRQMRELGLGCVCGRCLAPRLRASRLRVARPSATGPARAPGRCNDASAPARPAPACPAATTRPPPAPPSGPRSMTQSAVLITSRLCSMTTTVLPAVDEAVQHLEQLADVLEVQAGRRLVEDVERLAGAAAARVRWPA